MSASLDSVEIRVRCWAPLSSLHQARLRRVSDRLSWEFLEPGHRENVTNADVLVAPHFRLELARSSRPHWIQFDSAGVDDILDDLRRHPDIRVTNASGVYATLIAEFVLANLLRVSSDAVRSQSWRTERRWPTDADERASLRHEPLRGQTAAIIGYGGVGREIARLLSALGVRIVAVKARPESLADSAFRVPGTGDPEGTIPATVVGAAEIGKVVAESNILILTAPLTPRTRHLVDSRVLAAVKPGSLLVNVGRGALIDEGALLKALDGGRVSRAILDVLEEEPPPQEHPFWVHPKVDLTPHLSGGGSALGGNLFAMLLEENVQRFVRGTPLLNQIDLERGY